MDETSSESMSESSGEQPKNQPDRPPRRQRYAGKNPRNFSEKYKELRSEEYPSEIVKIVSHGRTPAGTHRPIMVDEIMLALRLVPGSIVADCTLAYGGHSTVMLKAIQPNGRLIAMDHDPYELAKTELRLPAVMVKHWSLRPGHGTERTLWLIRFLADPCTQGP